MPSTNIKRGDDWRPNSHYDQHNAYIHLSYQLTEKFRITTEYTLMKYLAQQPGGLTDEQFKADPSVSVRSSNWFKVDWNLISVNLDYQLGGNTRLNMAKLYPTRWAAGSRRLVLYQQAGQWRQ